MEAIDIWDMKRTAIADGVCGPTRLRLPGKEGIAILMTRLEGDKLN